MQISNTTIKGILIDDIDADLERWRWSLTTTGYPRRGGIGAKGRRREPRLSRVIASRMANRALGAGEDVDHINGNPLDNRRGNLRITTHQQNLWNQAGHKNSTSPYVGVCLCRRLGRQYWRAYIMLNAVHYGIGQFDDQHEAAWMRDQWTLALFGDYGRLNFDYEPVPIQAGRPE